MYYNGSYITMWRQWRNFLLLSGYDKNIMEKSYNIIILIIGLFSGIMGVYGYFKIPSNSFNVVNLLLFLSGIIIYFLRHKIEYNFKLYLIFFLSIILDVTIFSAGAFTGSGRIILVTLVILAASFCNIKVALILGALGVLYITIVSVLFNLNLYSVSEKMYLRMLEPSYWYAQTSVTFISILISIISVRTIKKVLENKVDNLNTTLLIIDAHKEELEKLAYYDKLTTLPTKEKFKRDIDELLDSTEGIMLLMDIRGFSTYNSLFGTEYGDNILKYIGEELDLFRGKDLIACRTGSDEFVVFGNNWLLEDAERFLVNFTAKVNRRLKTNFYNHTISWHVGACYLDNDSTDFEHGFHNSTIAIDYSKKNHIEGVNLFKPEMTEEFEREKEIDFNLVSGIRLNEFKILFQKKYNAATNKLVGFEALSRWESSRLGYVSPREFIAVANNSNNFSLFSRFIFEKSIIEFSRHINEFPDDVTLSINISPRFFLEDDFIEFVKDKLTEYNFHPERLILEITEDLLINDIDVIVKKSKELRGLGIKLSLDDFGTGYSSLKYLTTLSFYEIKIDKSFIDNIDKSEEAFSLLSSIVAIAKITGYQVVAEGVENQDQVDSVLEAGCNVIQGYFYSKPVNLGSIDLKEFIK